MMPDRKIAHVLGFIDQYYFSRRFKQITGSSPRAFEQDCPAHCRRLASHRQRIDARNAVNQRWLAFHCATRSFQVSCTSAPVRTLKLVAPTIPVDGHQP